MSCFAVSADAHQRQPRPEDATSPKSDALTNFPCRQNDGVAGAGASTKKVTLTRMVAFLASCLASVLA